ncbi:hypothetical protein DUNSADRAFT_7955 [Dunaliella salina]|uniref:Uncharacterized protein n=1 Tax=Dunaliella salina TaxID=3046 RepID=A0ABQ7H633_DUNSA|nr:hypothetical protein DUNSADRAFT_7955 [Dunaliella salina]|eukprot:KAF5842302.1 hypothetical protein DUNSADRAFT_7955 [Dunaliella salina]
MLPSKELTQDRSHMSIQGSARLPDASIPKLIHNTQANASTNTLYLAVDATYSLEPALYKQLNSYLEDSKFGPFAYVSDAIFSLLQLRRKRAAATKAKELEQLLAAFVVQHHGSLESMLQWRQLLEIKKQRDAAAHPFSAPLLHQELANGNPDLRPVKGALDMLLSAAPGQQSRRTSFFDLLPDTFSLILSNLSREDKQALHSTCRDLRRALLQHTTSVSIHPKQMSNQQLQDVVTHLLGLCLGQASLTLRGLTIDEIPSQKDINSLDALTALNQLGSLRYLCLGEMAHVTSIQPLSELPTLERLELMNLGVRNIQPLAAVPCLQHLALAGLPVSCIQPLTALTSLRHLELRKLPVTDIEALAALTSLQHFMLFRLTVSNIMPLSKCKSLQWLGLCDLEQLTDITPLAACTSLQHLTIIYLRQVEDITPLSACTSLQQLKLLGWEARNVNSYDIRPLRALSNLQHLELSYLDGVTDLGPLSSCSSLQRLELSSLSVTNLEPLKFCSMLQHLVLRDLPVKDITPLPAMCKSLEHLELRFVNVADLWPLAECTSLQHLELYELPCVTSLEALAGCTGLRYSLVLFVGPWDHPQLAIPALPSHTIFVGEIS